MDTQQHRSFGEYVTNPAILIAYYNQQKDLPDAGLTPCRRDGFFSAQRIGDGAQVLNFLTMRPLRKKGATAALREMAHQFEMMENDPGVDNGTDDMHPCFHVGMSAFDINQLNRTRAENIDYSETAVLSKILDEEKKLVEFLSRPDVGKLFDGKIGIFLNGPQG